MNKLKFVVAVPILTLVSNIYSQSICKSLRVVPLVEFNQCNGHPWALVFEDDFETNKLDTFKWVIRPWAEGALCCGTQEYNSFENAVVSNGTLKIVAKNETVQRKAVSWMNSTDIVDDGYQNLRTYNYTSSNLWTRVKFDHGAFEGRIKIPKGKGFWSAFWTFDGEPWGEIDIFEFMNTNDIWGNYDVELSAKRLNLNTHYDYNNDGNDDGCSTNSNEVDFSQDFHIFTMTWEKDKIQFFVDGNLKRTDFRYYTTLGQGTGCIINDWQPYLMNRIYPLNPMHMILNLAIYAGGGAPDGSTTLPNQMEVDWVRYYKRTPCNTNVNITHASQNPLSSTVYNAIVGENIAINCDYNVNQLEVIGGTSINIGPGFTTGNQAYFVARIEPTVCNLGGGMVLSNQDEIISALQTEDTQIYSLPDTISLDIGNKSPEGGISIFPNPNSGSFVLNFGTYDFNDFQLAVVNSQGQIVYSDVRVKSNNYLVDLKEQPAGTYVLYLIDKKQESIITHRIIIQ